MPPFSAAKSNFKGTMVSQVRYLYPPILTRQDFPRRSGTISNTRLGFVEKTHASEALKVLILRPELSSAHLRCGINNGIGHG